MKNVSLILCVVIGLLACKTAEIPTQIANEVDKVVRTDTKLASIFEESDTFAKTITGFMLYDPEGDSTIYSVNEDKYMTPASNTKLFTYFAGLNVLGDKVPALKYVIEGDALTFWGTGDPSFLHPEFGSDDVYELLSGFDGDLYFTDSNFDDETLGPGWSWADYNSYYSAEKSPMPIYGNVARVTIEHIESYQIAKEDGEYLISPSYLRKYFNDETLNEDGNLVLKRERVGNKFQYEFSSDTSRYETDKPFHYTPEFLVELLADTLNRPVNYLEDFEIPEDHETVYGMESDSLFKYMLLPSDNHAAEQILLMVASEIGEDLNVRSAINHVVDTYLNDVQDSPNWRDGSGLSRYNLFTPRSIVALLDKLDALVDEDLLLESLPQGGKQGTIRRLYAHKEGGDPYVFAKTGTLSNNHCLSGFVITESGKKLIFSFMNNNYVIPTREVQAQMDEVLWYIHKNY